MSDDLGPKTVLKSLQVLIHTLLGFSHNNCVGVACIVTPHLDYSAVQAAGSVRRSSFMVFFINLVNLRPFSPAENAIAYVSSILAGKYIWERGYLPFSMVSTCE